MTCQLLNEINRKQLATTHSGKFSKPTQVNLFRSDDNQHPLQCQSHGNCSVDKHETRTTGVEQKQNEACGKKLVLNERGKNDYRAV